MSTTNNTIKSDVLLLEKILNGEFESEYARSIRSKGIDLVLIYAEFDWKYHFEHDSFVNNCYIKNTQALNERCIRTPEEYVAHIETVIKHSSNTLLRNIVENSLSIYFRQKYRNDGPKAYLELFDTILRGNFERNYNSYFASDYFKLPYKQKYLDLLTDITEGKKIEQVVVLAEFDNTYHNISYDLHYNESYIVKDLKTLSNIELTQIEYIQLLKTILTIESGSGIWCYDNKKNAKKDPYYDFLNGYSWRQGQMAFQYMSYLCRIGKNDTVNPLCDNMARSEYINYIMELLNLVRINLVEKHIKPCIPDDVKLDTILKKQQIGVGDNRRSIYKYLKSFTEYTSLHYINQGKVLILNRIDNITKGNVERKTELIEALTNSRNKENIERIRLIEDEIDAIRNREINSLNDAIFEKYEIAIKYALQLADPDEIAILFIKYLELTDELSRINQQEATPISNGVSNEYKLFEQCLDMILRYTSKSFEDLQASALKLDKDWGDRMMQGFESQIKILRLANSSSLPDVLYTYAAFCMSIYNFEIAEKCLIEAKDLLVRTNDKRNTFNLAVICSNLTKLYLDWKRVDEAVNNGELAIKYLKRSEIFVWGATLNSFYAQQYNLNAASYAQRYEYDKAEELYSLAINYISKENDSDPKVLFLKLMIAYNRGAILMNKKEYARAALCYEPMLWQSMLLYEMDKTSEHLALKADIHIALAKAQSHIANFDEAEHNAIEGVTFFNELCKLSEGRYSFDRLFAVQTLADVYDEANRNELAEKYYLQAIGQARTLVESGKYIAKTRLHEILTNLAGLYNKTENYQRAIDICTEVLEICEELSVLDEEYFSLETIKGLNNIAISFYNIGNIMDAFQANQRALEICENLLESGCNPEVVVYWQMKIEHDMNIMVAD